MDKPVQNATEDAVDTVVNDALEAYRSPWLVNILKTQTSPTVSNIETSPFQLPLDGSLPDEIISQVDACSSSTPMAVIHAFLHVDTGATCFVTNHKHELHCPVPTQVTCGTAQSGPHTTINALGTLILDLVTSDGLTIPIEAHQTPEIQEFHRRSMSVHALQELGYDVEHSLISTGNASESGIIQVSIRHGPAPSDPG